MRTKLLRDKWNDFQLAGLPGEESVLEAAQSGPELQRAFLVKNLLTPATLRLKPGALVSFTINKSEPGRDAPLFVNGQLGTVERIEVRSQKAEGRSHLTPAPLPFS